MKKYLFLTFSIIITASFSQSITDIHLDGSEKGLKLISFIESLEKKYPLHFYYKSEWIDGITIEESFEGQTLRDFLSGILSNEGLSFLEMNPYAIVILNDPSHAIYLNTIVQSAIREGKKVEKIQIGDRQKIKYKQNVSLHGIIYDSKLKKPLIGATVLVRDLNIGAMSDSSGRFHLTVPNGIHIISFSNINFEEKIIEYSIYSNGISNIVLEELPTLLEEVLISGAKEENTTSLIGQKQISMKDAKRAPSLFGEVDLIKQIQVLPGVTTAGEAAPGFNVRGGSVDQNLVLYDGVPIFNGSHAFGFFSSFNAQAIRDVSFYNGGIPAEYGGRVSSVLDIRSKEGSYEKWRAGGGIGIISSNVLVEGPLKKDKTSIALSLRSTYSNWFINTIRTDYINLQKSFVSFYDGSMKISHRFSNKTKISISGYASRDQFRLSGDSTYRWDNVLGSIRLDHQFSHRFSGSLSSGYGQYSYEISDRNAFRDFSLSYKIAYPNIKSDFHYTLEKHKLSFGLQSLFYGFDPGTLKPSSSESSIKSIKIDRQRSIESGIFLNDGITFNEKYFMEFGIRLSQFIGLGPANVNQYESSKPLNENTFTGINHYEPRDIIKKYYGFEPRLSFRYSITPTLSIKTGYNRIYQYLHLISNTTAITPTDIWQPSGYYFKPQKADQVSLGLFKNLKEGAFEASTEMFYKKIDNILDFKDGAQLILNNHIETDLLQGKGRAYGIEASFSKLTGRFTGSINYTYSRSLRTVQGNTKEESINEGKEYASNFDQPNIFNVNWKYGISRRFFFTGYFTYHTGRPVTVPESGFIYDHMTIANFSERNHYRIANYHRLDIAFIIEGNHKRKKIADGTWSLSFFNVYARKNPYTVFFKDTGDGVLRPYQLSILGTILPSLSYNFKL